LYPVDRLIFSLILMINELTLLADFLSYSRVKILDDLILVVNFV